MKKKKKFLAFIALLAFFIGCGILGIRIYHLNQTYQAVPIEVYETGEKVSFGEDRYYTESKKGYAVTVISSEILTTEQFLEKYQADDSAIPESSYCAKVFDLEVIVSNEDNTDTGLDLTDINLRKNAAYAGFSPVYYRLANADQGYRDTGIAIRPGTEITMHWVFGAPEQTYSRSSYEHLEDVGLELVLTLYPTKKVIRLAAVYV